MIVCGEGRTHDRVWGGEGVYRGEEGKGVEVT